MKKIIFLFLTVISLTNISYSQFGDILKKIPGVGEILEEPVSTSIKDAYPTAYWLKDLDKQISVTTGESYSTDLSPGYYKFDFKTFCLHAGGYAPTKGGGYLAAPLKGTRAKLIQNILTRYDDHQEIEQRDVQILIWGIEAAQKFSSYPSDFQLRVTPLLTPDEITLMEVDVKEIAMDLLPQDAKDILNLYKDLRSKLSDANASYEQIEQIAVRTGIPPVGKGSRNVEKGTWSSVGNGIYLRSFTDLFPSSQVELYVPPEVTIQKDNTGRIISLDDGSYRIEFQYESNSSKFKYALLKNFSTNEEISIENNPANDASIKSQTDEFISLVKKSFSKKKSKNLNEQSLKTLGQLKTIELSLNPLIEKSSWQANAYGTSVNALNGYISGLENGKIKGGSERLSGFDIHGVVFAPGNTSVQREGKGGNKEKEKHCKPEITIRKVSQDYLPKPGSSFVMSIDIKNLDEKCTVEKVKFKLNSGRELGRCINDKDPAWYDTRLDFYIDPDNGGDFYVSPDSLAAYGNGSATSIRIGCNDYGAYGSLSAEVTIDGVVYKAIDENSSAYYVTLPLDEDNDRIADKWEKDNNVWGLPSSWDEDPEPSGQANNGDGLTNYEEYRGFFVDDGNGGTDYEKGDPRLKEIFVIDEGQLLDIISWKSATGLKAHWLNLNQVYGPLGGSERDLKYRWVNFCSGYAKGDKYALNLAKRSGINSSECGVPDAWGCSWGPPKFADITAIFPDKIRDWLKTQADSLQVWLSRSPKGLYFGTIFLSPAKINKYINAVNNPPKFDELVNYFTNITVIHELGHACGVPHHCLQKINGECKRTAGVHDCPMRYSEYNEFITSIEKLSEVMDLIDAGVNLIVTYTKMKYCKTQDNCWSKLQVNDRINYSKIPIN